MHFPVHIRRPDGEAMRFSIDAKDAHSAAIEAARQYEGYIAKQIKSYANAKTGPDLRLKRHWEAMAVPRLIEVHGSDYRVIEKYTASQL